MNVEILCSQSVALYAHLDENRCMCLSSSDEMQSIFINMFQTCFENYIEHFDRKEEYQLLCIDILRLIFEIYVEEVSRQQKVCKEIIDLFNRLGKSDTFFKMMEYFLATDDKYLSWTFSKALSAIMYGMQFPVLKTWIESIKENLMQCFTQKISVNLLELLTSFMSYGGSLSKKDGKSKCKNLMQFSLLSVEDNYSYVCSELAPVWNHLVETYTTPPNSQFESHRLIAFLNLWKSLYGINLKENLSLVYFNKKFALDFLSHNNVPKSKAFNVYVDVIIHILSSNLNGKPWDTSEIKSIENAVSFAISADFLESLSNEENEFCSVMKTSTNESIIAFENEQLELSFSAKRVLFIFFNLLAEFQDKQLLCQLLEEMLKAMSQSMHAKDASIQIVDSFFEDDHLLFGVMLATLRIYLNLELEISTRMKYSVLKMFQHDLNPHVVFIQMLQLLNYNYSELLSFLLSDETCCLLYLTYYLKLLLKERDQFLQVHDMCRKKCDLGILCATKLKKVKEQFPSCQVLQSHETIIETSELNKLNNTSTDNDLTNLKPSKNSEMCNTFKEDFCTKSCTVSDRNYFSRDSSYISVHSLVSYSCSSSSEDEIEMECCVGEDKIISKTMTVLMNLRVGIQKLVDLKEFPYNIAPLLSLLISCEDLFR